MGFADLNIDAGLKVLNAFLEDKSYIQGWEASQADVAVYEAVKTKPDAAKYPHAARWFHHIWSKSLAALPGNKQAAHAYGPGAAAASPIKAAAPVAASPIKAAAAPRAASPTKAAASPVKAAPRAASPAKAAPRAASPAKRSASPAKKAPAPAADDDDDIDLFGEEDEEESAENERIKAARVAEYTNKKANKPKVIAKSMVTLDVKPWDDETDMKALTDCVKSIAMDGLVWGTHKLVAVGYGIKKLAITCVVEDDKVGIDDLSELIVAFEDYVQSVDVASFNKL